MISLGDWIRLAALVALAVLEGCRGQDVTQQLSDKALSVGVSSDLVSDWWFWTIIGIIALFFCISAIFVWRGFRNYRRYKAEMEAYEERRRLAAARGEMVADGGKGLEVELGALDTSATAPLFKVDPEELARRTGRRVGPCQTAELARSGSAMF